MNVPTSDSATGYRAYVSYSHQDSLWAQWLHKSLESYRVPRRLVGQTTAAGRIPPSLAPVFRDRDELPSATDLGRKVNEALGKSANLIVICSPRSATSRWVNEEVLAYKRLGRADRIFCLIIDGEPNASDVAGRAAEECFAPALRFEIGIDGEPTRQRTEPIAADARAGKDGKGNAKLKLIAGILDVGFDALKRRELARRNRRLAMVTSLALGLTVVMTVLAIGAFVSRNAAERRQKQAESLVDFMLGDLNDSLAQVQRLDILERVDDRAMSYFESLPSNDVTDEALAQRAKALEKIGTVRLNQGHLPAAMNSFQAALKLAGKLAEDKPAEPARQLAYANISAYIGKTYWHQGLLDDAQRAFESAKKILQRAAATAADEAQLQLQYQLAAIDNNIGHVLESRGRLDEANVNYQDMLQLSQTLATARPDNVDWAMKLGYAHNNLGKLALLRGDLATAVAEYSADEAIESKLAERDPKNNNQRENVVTARAILGRTLALTGDLETGARDLQQALDMALQLKTVDANNSGVQEDIALYATQLSRLRRHGGDLPAATALTDQSASIFRNLTEQEPANTDWQREYAETQLEQALQARAADRIDLARTRAQAALTILDALLAKQPDDRSTLLSTVGARLALATVIGDGERARQLREQALQAIDAVKTGSSDPRLRALHIEALLALEKKVDAQQAIKQLWESGYQDPGFVGLLKRSGIDYPANAAFSERLQAALRPATDITMQ